MSADQPDDMTIRTPAERQADRTHDDVRTAVDEALKRRLAEAAQRRTDRQALRNRRTAARTAGVNARNARKLTRLRRTQAVSDDLRRAVAALPPRARHALREQSEQAARKWADTLPALGAVWSAFAAYVADVEQLDHARRAADPREYVRVPRGPKA